MDERNHTIKLAACNVEKIEIFGGCAHETPLQFIDIFSVLLLRRKRAFGPFSGSKGLPCQAASRQTDLSARRSFGVAHPDENRHLNREFHPIIRSDPNVVYVAVMSFGGPSNAGQLESAASMIRLTLRIANIRVQ